MSPPFHQHAPLSEAPARDVFGTLLMTSGVLAGTRRRVRITTAFDLPFVLISTTYQHQYFPVTCRQQQQRRRPGRCVFT